ncbi:hypothetical protein M514_05520 [Trichuris suis]|uniref:Uncharacterized protein n=1 Tax=Trichuris suis TaxID=68888 RepID=A0A085M8Q8_9BILA|nr:hypothetical protein M513_05520 [Trichuris suis]KFD62829.1 hypothetical protein M514_05520 [Trichuris suis]
MRIILVVPREQVDQKTAQETVSFIQVIKQPTLCRTFTSACARCLTEKSTKSPLVAWAPRLISLQHWLTFRQPMEAVMGQRGAWWDENRISRILPLQYMSFAFLENRDVIMSNRHY